MSGRLSLFGWGWHNEAGIQVIRLIASGLIDRHRGLKIMSGHRARWCRSSSKRVDDIKPPAANSLARAISDTDSEQVWASPGGMLNLPQFRFIHETLGQRILFSVDYPFLTMIGART